MVRIRKALTAWTTLTALALVLMAAPAAGQTVFEFYHTDAAGSIRAVTDLAGAVLRTYDYGPFGELEAGNCTQSQDARLFTGQERDTETCLDYFGARHYRSTSGRFLTVDPVVDIQRATTDPQHWNRYAYARNNPTKFVDPDGKNPWLIAWLAYEVGSAAYDIYNAVTTVADPNATWAETGIAVGGAALSIAGPGGVYGFAGRGLANELPSTLARVVEEGVPTPLLGRIGQPDVFVTAADDIAGMNAAQIANRLGIDGSPTGFRVIEFPTPATGIASPVFRTNSRFVGRGRTIGGAREYVIPNGAIPPNAKIRQVQ